jgi:hypothetical protein
MDKMLVSYEKLGNMIEVYEDDNSIVHIGDKELFGFISDRLCNICSSKLIHFDDFDALFCPQCNEWAETKCSDHGCNFCKNRPERPI